MSRFHCNFTVFICGVCTWNKKYSILIFKIITNFFFSLHIFDTDYTPMQRRSADIALQTPLQKRLTSTLNDVLYWKEEGREIFHALIVWFWDFLGTQWGDISFKKAFVFLWSKIQQMMMLVMCQRFGDLFLFRLVWQYSSIHTK